MSRPIGLAQYVLRDYTGRTAWMVVLLAIAGILEGLGIAAILPALDSMVSSATEPSDLTRATNELFLSVGLEPSLGVFLVLFVLLFALKGVALFLAELQIGFIIAKTIMELRLRLLRAVTWARWSHVLSYPSGFIVNAISGETQRTALAYHALTQVLAAAIQVLAYLVVAMIVSWQVASASLVVGVVIILLLQGRVDASQEAGKDQVHIIRSLLARLTDALPSLKPLKAMGMEGYLLPHLEQATAEYYEAQKRQIAATELLKKSREPLLMAALALGIWAVASFTQYSTASLMVLALLFYRTATSITNIQHFWVMVVVGEASFHSLMEHIDSAEAHREVQEQEGQRSAPSFERELRLERVGFSYDGETVVLHDVEASLDAGTFTVIVGPSGSGKTTLLDLITGLLRPTSGRITVDGVDLTSVSLEDWRHHIGYVPQNSMLFDDTIRNNITLGAPGIGDEEVTAALRAAHALEFVERFPAGLDHRIGGGGGALSGGQRQRLAIARALVRRPSLLILDEPTAALDSAAEEEVCAALDAIRDSLTILAISHQPALGEMADRIWEVRAGNLEVREGRPQAV
jgi:ATP-binding cassette subfamily C protein